MKRGLPAWLVDLKGGESEAIISAKKCTEIAHAHINNHSCARGLQYMLSAQFLDFYLSPHPYLVGIQQLKFLASITLSTFCDHPTWVRTSFIEVSREVSHQSNRTLLFCGASIPSVDINKPAYPWLNSTMKGCWAKTVKQVGRRKESYHHFRNQISITRQIPSSRLSVP